MCKVLEKFPCITKGTIVFAEDETERLLRMWLEPPSPGRRAHVKFEILGQDVMSVPVDIALEHWYHFCQSWSNTAGQWALYINGKLAATGEDWQVITSLSLSLSMALQPLGPSPLFQFLNPIHSL
jgi:hypothetical protein